MKSVATSSMQVTCAVLLALLAARSGAQTPLGVTRSGGSLARVSAPPGSRAALAREVRDSAAKVLRDALADRAFPGAYVIIGDARGTLTGLGVGHLDWAKSSAPTRHTLWDLASLTKVVGTTTAAAQLVERGVIALDSSVQHYLADWQGPGKERVTIRHLLTHTSGLPGFRPYDQQTHDADSIANLLFQTDLQWAPGDSMVYSDIGAFVLGRVIEHTSGERLDRYITTHVLKPLGMRETMFNPTRSLRARVAPTEYDSTRGGLVRGAVHDERAYYLGGVAAHAGLFSSAADMARFAEMLLHEGTRSGKRVLRAETVRQFTAYVDSTKSNRALGWQKLPASWGGSYMSSRAFGHTGFTGTSIAVDPTLDLYIVLLSNRVNPTRNNVKIGDVRSRLADAVVTVVRRRRGLTLNAGTP